MRSFAPLRMTDGAALRLVLSEREGMTIAVTLNGVKGLCREPLFRWGEILRFAQDSLCSG